MFRFLATSFFVLLLASAATRARNVWRQQQNDGRRFRRERERHLAQQRALADLTDPGAASATALDLLRRFATAAQTGLGRRALLLVGDPTGSWLHEAMLFAPEEASRSLSQTLPDIDLKEATRARRLDPHDALSPIGAALRLPLGGKTMVASIPVAEQPLALALVMDGDSLTDGDYLYMETLGNLLAAAWAVLSDMTTFGALGKLTAAVAHDVQGPLGSIRMNAQSLSRSLNDLMPVLDEYASSHGDFAVGGTLFSKTRDRLVTASQDIGLAAGNINEVLEPLRRLGGMPDHPGRIPIDVAAVLERAVVLSRAGMPVGGATHRVDVAPGLPSVVGSSEHLELVLVLLLTCTYRCRDADEALAVTASHDRAARNVVLSFTTRAGSGDASPAEIAAAELAARIVGKHGGTLDVVGGGVRVTLPVAQT